ncbi:MAG: hypothetical protein QM770_05805 [Tepidisphaeraceae bacterium]
MWELYKKRFLPTQAFVLVCAAIFYFVVTPHDWQKTLSVVIVMEIFSVFGAVWGNRIKQALEKRDRMG